MPLYSPSHNGFFLLIDMSAFQFKGGTGFWSFEAVLSNDLPRPSCETFAPPHPPASRVLPAVSSAEAAASPILRSIYQCGPLTADKLRLGRFLASPTSQSRPSTSNRNPHEATRLIVQNDYICIIDRPTDLPTNQPTPTDQLTGLVRSIEVLGLGSQQHLHQQSVGSPR